jgi:hypothetical protein
VAFFERRIVRRRRRSLATSMTEVGRAIMEERLIPTLLEDLAGRR